MDQPAARGALFKAASLGRLVDLADVGDVELLEVLVLLAEWASVDHVPSGKDQQTSAGQRDVS
jgi:hypothetical protein